MPCPRIARPCACDGSTFGIEHGDKFIVAGNSSVWGAENRCSWLSIVAKELMMVSYVVLVYSRINVLGHC